VTPHAAIVAHAAIPTLVPAAFVLVATGAYLVGRERAPRKPPLARELELVAALVTVVVAFGPLETLTDELFAAHMAQHVLLLMVFPALVVLARPWPVLRRALPIEARRTLARTVARPTVSRIGRTMTKPVVAFAVWSLAMTGSHIPTLYEAALTSPVVHVAQHATLLGAGLVYWMTLVGPVARRRSSPARRAAWATAGMVVSWALAVILAGAGTPLYQQYASAPTRPFGLSALADQGIAAGIMWVPGSIPLTIVVLVCATTILAPGRPARARAARAEGVLERTSA
jgi:putative membrane protein